MAFYYDFRPPRPALREYVRLLQIIHLDFSNSAVVPYKAYWPRAENCLAFYARDAETIVYPGSEGQQIKPRSVLVGQPTVLTNRFMGRDFMVLQVVFQPGALFRLTGLPVHELTDTFVDAEAVFSSELQRVNERLNSTDDSGEMLAIIEGFLRHLIQKNRRDCLPIDRISHLMLNAAQLNVMPSPLNWSVDWLAKEACLSNKQFYRKSMERLGISTNASFGVI